MEFDFYDTEAAHLAECYDGLHADDWVYWFKNYDLSKPLAIIHFTKFRY